MFRFDDGQKIQKREKQQGFVLRSRDVFAITVRAAYCFCNGHQLRIYRD